MSRAQGRGPTHDTSGRTGLEPSTPVLFWDAKTYLPYDYPDVVEAEREVLRRLQAHAQAHAIDEAHGDVVDVIVEEWKHAAQKDIDTQCSARLGSLLMIYEQGVEHTRRLHRECQAAISAADNANNLCRERYETLYGVEFSDISDEPLSAISVTAYDGLPHRPIHDRLASWIPEAGRSDSLDGGDGARKTTLDGDDPGGPTSDGDGPGGSRGTAGVPQTDPESVESPPPLTDSPAAFRPRRPLDDRRLP
jgi:hypothetical protein